MKKYNFDVYEKENGEAPFSVYLVSILSLMVSRKKHKKPRQEKSLNLKSIVKTTWKGMSKKMENKLQKYFDTQMDTPEFAEAWRETEASYQAANILLKIRAEKQLTQSELANLTGKKQSYIARVEKGTQNISVQTLNDIVESAGGKLKIEVVV